MNNQYIFKEINDKLELQSFMRLRKEEFEKTSQSTLLNSERELDIDIYDLHSRHFGLYKSLEPVGYIRGILPRAQYFNYNACEIAHSMGLFEDYSTTDSLVSCAEPQFHFETCIKLSEKVSNELSAISNNSIVEVSRIVLFGNNKGLGLARFVTECMLVLYCQFCIHESRHGIINCFTSHAKFYQSYGFELIDGELTNLKIPNIPDALLILRMANHLNQSTIPVKYQAKIESMFHQWQQDKIITFVL